METTVEATMSQKCVNRNMMQAPPKSKEEQKDMCDNAAGDCMRFVKLEAPHTQSWED